MSTTTSDSTPSTDTDPRGVVAPLLFGFFPNQVLHVAATLALPDRLLDGPRTSDDLAAETGTHGPSLYRVLRALACFGIVAETGPGTFALGPHGRSLLTDDPASLRHLVLLFSGDGVWRSWGELGETVRTGEPAWDRVTGRSAFEFMADDPDYRAMFNRAMGEGTRNAVAGVLEVGDFGRFGHVTDVGGGDGTLLAAVLAAHPGLRGTVFDTADGMAEAAPVLAAAGVADRCTAVAGDFFAAVPAGADAYLIKSVIHDWDDEKATAVLVRVREAMPAGATLLVVEPVMPDTPSPSPDVLMMVMSDLNMLVCTGGRERTEAEFRALLTGAGFALTRITPATGPTNFSVLEAVVA
jgi:orsellinic acid C2-O-methyltransferase